MLVKKIIKKDGTVEPFNIEKVVVAIKKSASRVLHTLSSQEQLEICRIVEIECDKICKETDHNYVTIEEIHCIVEGALENINPKVAKSYRDYRNYKNEFVYMMDKVYQQSQKIYYVGDKENSNTDSALVSTKRSLVFGYLNKELYQKFFLNKDEIQACRDGYIYIHDMSARRDTMNCCLFDVSSVLKGGFEMGNIWYNEPNSLDTAFDVIGDITLSAASQQYGGFTLPNIETILAPYAEKSYNKYYNEYLEIVKNLNTSSKDFSKEADEYTIKKLTKEMEQGFQGWEYKFNTVASSRGDYPFITISAGVGQNKFEQLATLCMLNVRKEGQGEKEHKKPVLFPKLVFLYDENLHGEGKPLEYLFNAGIECSRKTMYPDWLSLTGEGYVPSMYEKYGKAISPMGCVDGQEVITYKYKDVLYVESFERLWNKVLIDQKSLGQKTEDDKNLFILTSNLTIYDTVEKTFVKVNKLIRNIQSNWVKVTMSNGRFLNCTDDHPFHTTNRGRVLADELNLDDEVIISNKQYFDETIHKDNLEAWLYGFMLCDGCYQNYSVFASIAEFGEDDIENKFKEAIKKVFGYDVKTIIQHRGNKGNYKDLRIVSNKKGNLTYLIDFFTKLYGGLNKINRQIPNEVFSWNREARLSFLAGIIDADGYVHETTKKQYCSIQVGSINKELSLQQMLLFQSLNMYAKLYINNYDAEDLNKIRYKIDALPSEELSKFIVCMKKVNNLDENYDYYINHQDITNAKITKKEYYKQEKYSYDVQTESDHFEVSGIYSHNCRAFLSPWFEKGGIEPADENDTPVFVGRFNIGAVSLHLPMILSKARKENKDFYEVLDFYLEMIRQVHIKTYNYLGEMKASVNPLGFCEGGFYGGNLGFHDKIRPILKSSTASFGVTALNELQRLYNGKSIKEDGEFALEVMEYINKKTQEFKQEDNILYALYGTPAESLCFHGDTEVQTYKGNKKIKDITINDLVYSFNEEKHKVELKRVLKSKQTRINSKVVKVLFDNGQEIICTRDHPFAVRIPNKNPLSGKFEGTEKIEYIEAINLTKGSRIKSNYIFINDLGRPSCSICNNGKKQLIQDIHAEYIFGDKNNSVVHHKDGNKNNNEFENLEYLTDSEHKKYHYKENLEKHQYTSESQTGTKNSFYNKHHTEKSKQLNRQKHIGKSLVQFDKKMNFVKHFECLNDTIKFGYTRNLVKKACDGKRKVNNNSHYYKNSYWFYTEDCNHLLETNHKVVSVITLKEKYDVYDIEVEDNHNFFVGGDKGILVHNCGTQIQQFRKMYGVIENVSDKEYVSNSFHCHVSENITPIEKQDSENRFWNLFNGGKIQYCKYPISYNVEAIKTLVRRAMKMGLYEGVNLSLSYCDDCGHEELDMEVCPKCGSTNLTKIDRMNGYLSYSRVKGDTRLNDAKMAEIKDRRSM